MRECQLQSVKLLSFKLLAQLLLVISHIICKFDHVHDGGSLWFYTARRYVAAPCGVTWHRIECERSLRHREKLLVPGERVSERQYTLPCLKFQNDIRPACFKFQMAYFTKVCCSLIKPGLWSARCLACPEDNVANYLPTIICRPTHAVFRCTL